MFIDNLFAPKAKWLEEFSRAYREEIGLPFFCETNPNVHNVHTMRLLAQAGCTLLQFGFQSANERVRREILHRPESNAKIRELVKEAKRHGMLVCIDHIANLPGEKEDHFTEALSLYRELRPHWVNLGFLQYYPRAEIIDIALAHKTISQEDLATIFSGLGQSSFRLLSKSQLGECHRTLPMRLYAAFKLPRGLGDRVSRWLDRPGVAKAVSPLASVFIYTSRILSALTDRRDFLVRHHILRNLHVMKIILREKLILRR